MKVTIHPRYEHLREFICRIPAGEYRCEETMRNRRNKVERVAAGGVELVIKRYKRPNLINRFAYSFVRMSKARRSYCYAERLLKMGIGSAEPVAWIEEYKQGLFHTGYFIYTYQPYPLLEEVVHCNEEVRSEIVEAFVRFTADLHRQGVVHWDYNAGNILFYRENGTYRFLLIDINRMRFGKHLSKRDSVLALRNLQWPFPLLVEFVARYADHRGWDRELTCGYLLIKRRIHPGNDLRHWAKRTVARIKRFFKAGMPVEGFRQAS